MTQREFYTIAISLFDGSQQVWTPTELAKKFREAYPNKTIWVWSGFLFDDLKDKEIMNYIDVLVDGQFKDELKNADEKVLAKKFVYYCRKGVE